jgi:hypothetical protein
MCPFFRTEDNSLFRNFCQFFLNEKAASLFRPTESFADYWTELYGTAPFITDEPGEITRQNRLRVCSILKREIEAMMCTLDKSDPIYRYAFEKGPLR